MFADTVLLQSSVSREEVTILQCDAQRVHRRSSIVFPFCELAADYSKQRRLIFQCIRAVASSFAGAPLAAKVSQICHG